MDARGEGGRGNQKTESPQANCGEWAVGGWSQLFGLGGGLSQEAREGVCGQLGACGEVALLHQDTSWVSKPVPPQSLTKATFWSGQQTSQLGQSCAGGG